MVRTTKSKNPSYPRQLWYNYHFLLKNNWSDQQPKFQNPAKKVSCGRALDHYLLQWYVPPETAILYFLTSPFFCDPPHFPRTAYPVYQYINSLSMVLINQKRGSTEYLQMVLGKGGDIKFQAKSWIPSGTNHAAGVTVLKREWSSVMKLLRNLK